jgi:hypothetical protein
MAAKGSKLSKAIGYFQESDLDEARVAYALVGEIINKRLGVGALALAAKKTRKPRTPKAKTNLSSWMQT